jgi:hypothetical protein
MTEGIHKENASYLRQDSLQTYLNILFGSVILSSSEDKKNCKDVLKRIYKKEYE